MVIDALAAQIAPLTEQLTLVLERLSLNSRNSSKPPSSDGPGAGMNRAQRRASERKRGAQKGHPGAWRQMVPDGRVPGMWRRASWGPTTASSPRV